MNVCLLNDSFPPVLDGVANVVMNYGRIMKEDLGANVVVGTPKYPNADYSGYPYDVIAYPSMNTAKLANGYRTGNPLAMREVEQMTKFDPDIIHSHCPAASTYMARVLQREVKSHYTPIVFTYHTKFDEDIAKALGNELLERETIKVMVNNISACDEIWVVSEGAGKNLNELAKMVKLPEFECRVMPNGVDFPKGKVDADKVREVTGKYDLPEGVPVFLFVGRMMKYKGLPLIIDALRGLSAYGIDYRMIFIGGGLDAEEMQTRARDYGIALDITGEDKKITH
ncbi:MAG: glycosyltransferase, partial [Lachnospiraceae bacterium]|nr:glycosyltransferase [Lachnospiraceae bacterium]